MKIKISQLDDFITEGTRIEWEATPIHRIICITEEEWAAINDLRRRYLVWIEDIRKFLKKENIPLSIRSPFDEPDKVIETLNMGRHIDIETHADFARRLLESIRTGTKEKLMYLRNLPKLENVNFNVIYLNDIGDLWREPKKRYCYPMAENSDRHKIIRYLTTNKGYQQTLTISSVLNSKSEQSIRTEIGKIRKNIKKFLRIEGKEIIESRGKSGYRVNPKYRIVLKKE